MKKRLTFDELVDENRKQILEDQLLMEKIEKNIEMKRNQILKNSNKQ